MTSSDLHFAKMAWTVVWRWAGRKQQQQKSGGGGVVRVRDPRAPVTSERSRRKWGDHQVGREARPGVRLHLGPEDEEGGGLC